jgi:hypothetical protein
MGTVQIRSKRHNPKRHFTSHYEALRRNDSEFHPVDVAVEARVRHGAVRRRIRALQAEILKELGAKAKSFLQLDALANDERHEREAAYFDLGYEYGSAGVRRRVMRQMARRDWPERLEHVAARLQDEVFKSALSSSETLLVLAESLWVLAVRVTRPGERPGG